MAYIRVIPRDLFNEANLLKCLGQLALQQDYLRGARFDVDDVDRFDVQQNPNDGSIYVSNLPFSIGGRPFHLYRPLNSRQPWPLWLTAPWDNSFDPIQVFAGDGTLSIEFRALVETCNARR